MVMGEAYFVRCPNCARRMDANAGFSTCSNCRQHGAEANNPVNHESLMAREWRRRYVDRETATWLEVEAILFGPPKGKQPRCGRLLNTGKLCTRVIDHKHGCSAR